MTLAPGASASFDLPAPLTAIDAASRVAVRPVLRRILPPNPITPLGALLTSTELFDSISGISTVAFPPVLMLPLGLLR